MDDVICNTIGGKIHTHTRTHTHTHTHTHIYIYIYIGYTYIYIKVNLHVAVYSKNGVLVSNEFVVKHQDAMFMFKFENRSTVKSRLTTSFLMWRQFS